MDYVFLIYTAEAGQSKMTKEAGAEMKQAYLTYTKELVGTGSAGDRCALEGTSTATSVRVRDGKRTVSDGPFAETREQLAGYYSLTAGDPEEAMTWAAKIPGAKVGRIEVRPVMAMPPPQGGEGAKKITAKDGYKEYVLLIYDDENAWAKMDEATRNAMFGRYMEFTKTIAANGHYVAGAPLQPIKTAKTVHIEGAKRVVVDGPFAETREQLGGYYRVWAKDLDEAIDLAARIPSAEIGTIEVRPASDMSAYV